MRYKSVTDYLKANDLFPYLNVADSNKPEAIINGKKVLLFCSLNYLGLAGNEEVKRAAIRAIEKHGVGSGGSRFISGNYALHEELEKKIAEFKGEEDAVIFQSGYVANVSVIPALASVPDLAPFPFAGERFVIFSDALNHASIIDGIRVSGAKKIIYKHCDIDDLEEKLAAETIKNKIIVTDSVFSMDGDVAPLPGITALAAKSGSLLMIDEAHATGILGERGSGAAEFFGLEGKIDVTMGTLSKALGSMGGYVAGKKEIIEYLRIFAHSSLFSVSMAPALAAAAIAAIDQVAVLKDLRKKLLCKAKELRAAFKEMGFRTLESPTLIIPLMIGDELKAIKMSRLLLEKNIYVGCSRYPVVEKGKARIRVTLMAGHTDSQLEYLLEGCREAGLKLGTLLS